MENSRYGQWGGERSKGQKQSKVVSGGRYKLQRGKTTTNGGRKVFN